MFLVRLLLLKNIPTHTRCVVGVCNDDKRYPEHQIKHSNVKENPAFHKLPTDSGICRAWVKQSSKGRSNVVVPNNVFVCSDHFLYSKTTILNPVPTLFLTISGNTIPIPKKRNPPRKRLVMGSDAAEIVSSTPTSVDLLSEDDSILMQDKASNTDVHDEAAPYILLSSHMNLMLLFSLV